jgi:hypothetical protein
LNKVIQDYEIQKTKDFSYNRSLGVIYTPELIVDHLVRNVIKLYLEDFFKIPKTANITSLFEFIQQKLIKQPSFKTLCAKKLSNFRLLDPACGSGRFLISIANILYTFLKIIYPERDEFEIKRSIVQENLFGIEIEKSAYIVTKLRLFLWAFSGNPMNIRLPTIITSKSNLDYLNQKINEFDINFNLYNLDFLLEYKSDKVDIIIGNPPYIENKKIENPEFKKKLIKRFQSAYRLYDLSILFIERALELLKEKEGYFSMITINKFLSADYGVYIRELLVNNTELKEINNISSLPIFRKAAVYPIIITFKKSLPKAKNSLKINIYEDLSEFIENRKVKSQNLPQNLIKKVPKFVFPIFGQIKLIDYLFSKYNTFVGQIKDLDIIYRPYGFINWAKHLNQIDNKANTTRDLILIGTGNLGKYHIKFDKPIRIAKKKLAVSYFKYQDEFEKKWKGLMDQKLVFREIAKELTWSYDPGIYTNVTGLYFVKIPSFNKDKLFSLLAIMNSKLMDRIFKTLFSSLHMAGGYLRFNGSFIKRLPLPREFPLSLSVCGRYTQILSQLNYDFCSKHIIDLPELTRIKNKYQPTISNLQNFFIKLNNSLVKLLYLEDLYLEQNVDFENLRNLLYSKMQPNKIQFKHLLPRYQIDKYETYTLDELQMTLDTIKSFSEKICKTDNIIDQIDHILNKDLFL